MKPGEISGVPLIGGVAGEANLCVVRIRCTCTPEQKLDPDWHGNKAGRACPNGERTDLGEVAYYHPSRTRRVIRRLERLFGRHSGDASL